MIMTKSARKPPVGGPLFGSPWDLRLVTPSHGKPAGSHYTCNGINGDAMDIIRLLEPNELNWVFLSTSGVHGSYCSLDDIEFRLWDGTDAEVREDECAVDDPEWTRDTTADITVLIVLPRIVATMFGNGVIRTREDVALLRRRVEQTFEGIANLQKGNREKETK